MAARVTIITAAVLILSISLLLFSPKESITTSAIPQIIDIEQDLAFISVSQDETGSVELNVSIRSPSNQNIILNIQSELKGAPFWNVDHIKSIYLEPFEEWKFKVTVTAPAGERADKEVELILKVTSDSGLVTGEDSCRLKVLPFLSTEVSSEVDYLLERPLVGSFPLIIKNNGNSVSPVGLTWDGEIELTLGGSIMLDPGEKTTLNIDYNIPDDLSDTTTSITSFSGTTSGNGLDVRFILERPFVHILFKKGPFLVLLPGILEKDSVKVICIGGELTNVGIEVMGPGLDHSVDSEKGVDLDHLEGKDLILSGKGYSGTQLLTVHAYGFWEEQRVISNNIKVPVTGEDDRSDGIPTAMILYAGGGTVAIGATLTGTIAYLYSASEIFRYRWLLIAFIPLYSTVHGEKVLDHFFRGRLFEFIKEHPGVTFTALKDHFEVNNGTLTYHLHKLEKEELIVYRNYGKYKLFYADGVRIKGVEAVISPIDKEIFDLITDNPGISSGAIISNLTSERSARTISRHLKQLERKGFISSDRRDGRRIFFVSSDLERVLLPGRGVIEVSEIAGLDI